MSCDYAVWNTAAPIEPRKAAALYAGLCEGVTTDVAAHPSIAAFYESLTAHHPEIDEVPEDRVDDTDFCPWSIAFDRSEGHIIMCCVWSKADYCGELISDLAAKHGLTFYDPQSDRIADQRVPPAAKAWWKFW